MNGSIEWVLNVSFAIFLLALLVDWRTFLTINILGIGCGYLFYNMVAVEALKLSSKTIFAIIYVTIFSVLISLIFGRRREVEQDKRMEDVSGAGSVIAHDVRSPMVVIVSFLENFAHDMKIIERGIEEKDGAYTLEMDKQEYEMLFQKIPQMMLQDARKGLKDVEIYLDTLKDIGNARDIGVYSIRKMLIEAIEEYSILYPKHIERLNFADDASKDFEFGGTALLTKRIIFNIIKNAFYHGGSKVNLEIWIEGKTMHLKDDGFGISEDVLSELFVKHKTGGLGTGLGLWFVRRTMEGQGGSAECDSEEGEYIEFKLRFPKKIQTYPENERKKKERERRERELERKRAKKEGKEEAPISKKE